MSATSTARASSVPSRWQEQFLRPLVDLGTLTRGKLRGIWSPVYDEAVVRAHVHEQFVEDAAGWAARFASDGYHEWLVSTALGKLGLLSPPRPLRVLDVGSGAGNSIFPLLRLLPDAALIASDFSVELLLILRSALERLHPDRECGLLQLNAEALEFQPGSFDLVVGAAILHHLFHPERTIVGCAQVLRPGGAAIFFEPFENGNQLLRMMYGHLLADPRSAEIAPAAARLLQALITDFDLRKGRDKSAPVFGKIDDKWLFTLSHVRDMAKAAGFSSCTVYPVHDTARQFQRQTEVYLQLGAGAPPESLPPWAWALISSYDASFSEDCKADFLIEGCVLLVK